MTLAEPWTCPTCGRTATSRWCADCGERPRDPRDLTLPGLALQVLHAFTSLDGKLVQSLRCLVTRPGALTAAYVQGQRARWVGPIQLFLLANVAFFACQSFTHMNVLSAPLQSHLQGQDWSPLARRIVAEELEERGTTLAEYSPVFDRAVVLHGKSLVVLMTVPFALLLPLVFRRSRQPFVAHAVFALHVFAFMLLVFCVALGLGAADGWRGGAGFASRRTDLVLTVFDLAVCAVYLYAASGAFYGARGVARVAKAAGLALAVGMIVLAYRFGMFLLTLQLT